MDNGCLRWLGRDEPDVDVISILTLHLKNDRVLAYLKRREIVYIRREAVYEVPLRAIAQLIDLELGIVIQDLR